jgi:hypothetical protein
MINGWKFIFSPKVRITRRTGESIGVGVVRAVIGGDANRARLDLKNNRISETGVLSIEA